MIRTDNNYPNTARIYTSEFTGNADMPYDFFMSRYKQAYVEETLAFVDALVHGTPSPCSGEDGLVALVMAIAAGKSAEERRWVDFAEMAGELCAMGDNDACALDVVDNLTGAIQFSKLLSPQMGIVVDRATGSGGKQGGKGFGGGEATRDPEPTVIDPNDPKGKQQAIHKAESFAEYLAKRG